VPAGNWNPTQPLYAAHGFVEWPAGPLVLADGESMVRVEVWLMQESTGAVQMTYQSQFPPNPTSWLADQVWYPKPQGYPPWTGGLFRPGCALGTAVAIARKGTVQRYYWWTQEVQLL